MYYIMITETVLAISALISAITSMVGGVMGKVSRNRQQEASDTNGMYDSNPLESAAGAAESLSAVMSSFANLGNNYNSKLLRRPTTPTTNIGGR